MKKNKKFTEILDDVVAAAKAVKTILDDTNMTDTVTEYIRDSFFKDTMGRDQKVRELMFVMNWIKTHDPDSYATLFRRNTLAWGGRAPHGITAGEVEMRLREQFPAKLTAAGAAQSSAQQRANFFAKELITWAKLSDDEFWSTIVSLRGNDTKRRVEEGIQAFGQRFADDDRTEGTWYWPMGRKKKEGSHA